MREAHVGFVRNHRLDDRLAAPIRHVDVDQHDIRRRTTNRRDGFVHLGRGTDELDAPTSTQPSTPDQEQAVVVDEEDARHRFNSNATSVAFTRRRRDGRRPPFRAIRSRIDDAIPCVVRH